MRTPAVDTGSATSCTRAPALLIVLVANPTSNNHEHGTCPFYVNIHSTTALRCNCIQSYWFVKSSLSNSGQSCGASNDCQACKLGSQSSAKVCTGQSCGASNDCQARKLGSQSSAKVCTGQSCGASNDCQARKLGSQSSAKVCTGQSCGASNNCQARKLRSQSSAKVCTGQSCGASNDCQACKLGSQSSTKVCRDSFEWLASTEFVESVLDVFDKDVDGS